MIRTLFHNAVARLRSIALDAYEDERGDVPGWVLVTVMSAGVVAVLYGVAKDELTDMLRSALNKVQ